MDIMKDLESLGDVLSEKISEKTRKIKNGGMNDGDLETVDKLTHALASVKKIEAFVEDDGYSGYWPTDGSYRGMYRNSYAHGGRRRDSMGRYSHSRYGRGYSGDDNMIAQLRELMEEAKDDKTRQEFQKFINKVESM